MGVAIIKRADIKCGFKCNNNCLFCAQAHKKQFGNKTTEQVKKEILEARKTCDSIVFTGGEITIRKDILSLISLAKNIGFKNIQLQTNARMLSNVKFCRMAIGSGTTEFSPALHGHTSQVHDFLTRAEKSFLQTTKAMKNLKDLSQNMYSNTVVTKHNMAYLPEIAELLVDLGVKQFQMAFVHPVGNAEKYFDMVVPNITEASLKIKEALQIGIDAGIKVMSEAMPYCLMQGYEDYIAERIIPDTQIFDLDSIDDDYTATRINHGKKKFEKCQKCSFNKICEGPWKEYVEKYGDKEFDPVI